MKFGRLWQGNYIHCVVLKGGAECGIVKRCAVLQGKIIFIRSGNVGRNGLL